MATGKVKVAAPNRGGPASRQQDQLTRGLTRAGEVAQRTDSRALEQMASSAEKVGEYQVDQFARQARAQQQENEAFLRGRLNEFEEIQKFSQDTYLRSRALGDKQADETAKQNERTTAFNLNQSERIRAENLKAVSSISETAVQMVDEWQKRRNEADLQAGIAIGMSGKGESELNKFDKVLTNAAVSEGQANSELAKTDIVQAEDQRQSSPIRRGYKAYGEAIGRSRRIAATWGLSITEFAESEHALLEDPEAPGTLISPKELSARGPAGAMAVMTAGTAFLMKVGKLENINPAILNEHLWPTINTSNAAVVNGLITRNRKAQMSDRDEAITVSIGAEWGSVLPGDVAGMSEWVNSKVAAYMANGDSIQEANKKVIPSLLDEAIRRGDIEAFGDLESTLINNDQPGRGTWGDHPSFKGAFAEAEGKLLARKKSDFEDIVEAADSLVPQVELQAQEKRMAAGNDPVKIAEVNKWERQEYKKLGDMGSKSAYGKLNDLNTKPLTQSEFAWDSFQEEVRRGKVHTDAELAQAVSDGRLTPDKARWIKDQRPVNAGNATTKSLESQIKAMVTKGFTRQVVQASGLNSIADVGELGPQYITSITGEVMTNLGDWVNSQKTVPPITAIMAKANEIANKLYQDKNYQVNIKKSENVGPDGKYKVIFAGPKGSPSNRMSGTKPNPNSPRGRSADLRAVPTKSIKMSDVSSNVVLDDSDISDTLAALQRGEVGTPRVQGISIQTGLSPASIIRSQARNANGTDLSGQLKAIPEVQRMDKIATVSPSEVGVLTNPNVNPRRKAWGYDRLKRQMSLLELRSQGAQAASTNASRAQSGSFFYNPATGQYEGDSFGDTQTVRPLLDLIAGPEAGAQGYNAVNRGDSGDTTGGIQSLYGKKASQMTIGEVRKLQSQGKIKAFGRYQIIGTTLDIAMKDAGLTSKDLMTNENQDRLGTALILGTKQPKLAAYIRGQSNDLNGATNQAAAEWAALKNTSGGGQYNKLAGNHASVSSGRTARAIQQARRNYLARGSGGGGGGSWDKGPSQPTSHPETGRGFAIPGMMDKKGRPLTFSRPAANSFAAMVKASGGLVNGFDVESTQRSPEKNSNVGGATGSLHLRGTAMDIHGASGEWIKKHGPKFGWFLHRYGGPGDHGGHFEFRG